VVEMWRKLLMRKPKLRILLVCTANRRRL